MRTQKIYKMNNSNVNQEISKPSRFDIFKERFRNNFLNLGYDYINYRHGMLKNANRFTRNLKTVTINS